MTLGESIGGDTLHHPLVRHAAATSRGILTQSACWWHQPAQLLKAVQAAVREAAQVSVQYSAADGNTGAAVAAAGLR
jgi:hypothetical protein